MKRAVRLAAALSLALAGAAGAQTLDGDGRVAVVRFEEGAIVPLRSAAGNGLTIIFAPGERVQAFEVADPAALEVSLSGSTDSLLVKTLSAPGNPHLSVRTQLRNYTFHVQLGPPESATYVVRFAYGPAPAAVPAGSVGRYKISGTKALRPSRIGDDGVRTYLEWAPDQALPAVFALNPLGGEEMVDGYMRGGVFTIDRIHPRLVFRIDKKSAKAERVGAGKGER
ncbi:MAG: TrbG/VirB9 family P-type conjugative transfer protein [Novosphingobium sp.]